MRPSLPFALSITLLALLGGCGGSTANTENVGAGQGAQNGKGGDTANPPVVANPTGTCTAPDSGDRAGYHSAGGDPWLPDCQNTLAREYWRVFAVSSTSAYIIPRPDGHPDLARACSDAQHPLHAIATAHALCRTASSQADVEKVNSIAPADALAVTHALHAGLRFVALDEGITPSPLPSDVVDACNLHGTSSEPELDAICSRERERMSNGNDIGFSYTGPGAVRLAVRLNELYRIPLD